MYLINHGIPDLTIQLLQFHRNIKGPLSITIFGIPFLDLLLIYD